MIYLYPHIQIIKGRLREAIFSLLKIANLVSPKLLTSIFKKCSPASYKARLARFYFESEESKIDDIVDDALTKNLMSNYLMNTSTLLEKIYDSIIRNKWEDRFLDCFYHDMRKRRFVSYLYYLNFSLNFDKRISNKIREYIVVINQVNLKHRPYRRDSLKEYNDVFTFELPEIIGQKRKRIVKLDQKNTSIDYYKELTICKNSLTLNSEGSYVPLEDAAIFNGKFQISGFSEFMLHNMSSYKKLICCDLKPTKTIDSALLFYGRNYKNFFHFMIEYMPRLFITVNFAKDNYKIILPDDLHKNLLDLVLLFINKKDIVFINNNEAIKVKNLAVPSFLTFIPDDYNREYPDLSLLNPKVLMEMRNKALKALNLEEIKPHRKIYLSRKSNQARTLHNSVDVENYFKSLNYEVIYPEKLSFIEQVRLFQSAKKIVGPGGAAFSNVLFCKKQTTIIGIIDEVNKDFCLHSNIATIVGAKFKYFTCASNSHFKEKIIGREYSRHQSFKVDLKKLKKYEKEFL